MDTAPIPLRQGLRSIAVCASVLLVQSNRRHCSTTWLFPVCPPPASVRSPFPAAMSCPCRSHPDTSGAAAHDVFGSYRSGRRSGHGFLTDHAALCNSLFCPLDQVNFNASLRSLSVSSLFSACLGFISSNRSLR